jgi:SRSO17 transposase
MIAPRPAKPTVQFIDDYCQWYQALFPEVRSFEAFKQLHLGLISEVKRKTLPAIAQVAGLDNAQSFHFLTESPWQTLVLRQQHLQRILQAIGSREIVLIIDDTGDRKKGQQTDYIERQLSWVLDPEAPVEHTDSLTPGHLQGFFEQLTLL